MAVSVQVVRFQKSTGGNGTTQDVDLTFTPKAIQLFSDGSTADNTISAHFQWIQGFSDGTDNACVCIASEDNSAFSDTSYTYRNDSVFIKTDDASNNTLLVRGSVTFSTNKATFTWTVNNSDATYITLMAYGGDGITDTKVDTVQVNTTGTGTVNYTGLGFNPSDGNSVLFILALPFMDSELNNVFDNASVGTGCAVSSTKRWAMSIGMQNNVDTTNTFKVHSNTNCLYMLHPATGAIMYSADFNAWITDGFQLDWTDAPSPSNLMFSYLVINGGTWDCGNFLAPTAPTNNVDYAVSVDSKPIRGLLINSVVASAYDSILTNAIFAIGATDGTNQSCIGIIDEDNQATSDSSRVNETNNIIRSPSVAGFDLDVATFDSFTTDNFRLDYSVAQSAIIKYYGWIVVAGDDDAAAEANGQMNFTAASSVGVFH